MFTHFFREPRQLFYLLEWRATHKQQLFSFLLKGLQRTSWKLFINVKFAHKFYGRVVFFLMLWKIYVPLVCASLYVIIRMHFLLSYIVALV